MTAAATAAVTAAATSSCSGRRLPRHGREAFRARGGEQLVVNRPEALHHEREGVNFLSHDPRLRHHKSLILGPHTNESCAQTQISITNTNLILGSLHVL